MDDAAASERPARRGAFALTGHIQQEIVSQPPFLSQQHIFGPSQRPDCRPCCLLARCPFATPMDKAGKRNAFLPPAPAALGSSDDLIISVPAELGM